MNLLAIRTNGDVEIHDVESSYEFLRDTIGVFDAIQFADVTLWINDEGLLDTSTFNSLATCILFSGHDGHRLACTFLYGDAVLSGGVDAHGDTLPISDSIIDMLRDELRCNVIDKRQEKVNG